MKTIKLSIQEIINDFEELLREDERLTTIADISTLTNNDSKTFYKRNMELCEKYIPNYLELLPKSFQNEDDVDKGITLFNMLYKNFKEIIFQLI